MGTLLFVPLAVIGFTLLADHPWWIALFGALVIVTMLISYTLHRRQKNGAKNIFQFMTKGFLVLACLLFAGSFGGAWLACTYDPDPFCIFGAAPFLSSALVTSFFALIAYFVSKRTEKKKEPEKTS